MEPNCIAEQLKILNYCLEPSKMEVIQDCRASKIILNDTKPKLIFLDSKIENQRFFTFASVEIIG